MTKKEPIYTYLRRRLDELKGQHNRIAIESGVPQSTVNRIHLGQGDPRLGTAQPLLDWFAQYDAKKARKPGSAVRVPNAKRGVGPGRPASRGATASLGK